MVDRPDSLSRGVFAGALCWLAQPLYLVAEVATAAHVTAPYSLLDNTISDLGATTCTVIEYPFGLVPVCSPWFRVMNASLVLFGLLLVAGAFLLRRRPRNGAAATIAVVLWVLSGSSSVGTGLVPLDRDLDLHTLVSLPAFLAQPAALIASAVALRTSRPALAWSAFVTGFATLAAAVTFFVRVDSSDLGGLFERLALWPGYLWVAATATVVIASRPGRSGLL